MWYSDLQLVRYLEGAYTVEELKASPRHREVIKAINCEHDADKPGGVRERMKANRDEVDPRVKKD